MSRLLFSALAREDLQQITRYIARDNPGRARSFVGELRVRCDQLLSQPNQGISRDEAAKGLKMIAHGRYLIFYSLIESYVQVERVLHSARDIARLFDSDNLDRQPQ
ncbi:MULTISPECIES: type II toxin-antitoxin system RelE/ParE family toxin [unclassified Pseudomonas]|uniref:type II toxin-antitoxin system RelE/ParE family toxin n=1 Tax=unclassified Pseudomonas TaxID=196821 RepID=UPI001B344E18|nr:MULTISPECIES: type II toxin-antitoxin system RelE/ParE family toxin [unclassified Pseudomonas]MBP5946283.1 type II toxin-antitoxin system RelE/ParE family toxin [Pseudomonas sp. P9(2020)]MBZ9564422.1 type II toxin-antitoxin system RelE/ParE family toxin [Pseudomonas sp. P116]